MKSYEETLPTSETLENKVSNYRNKLDQLFDTARAEAGDILQLDNEVRRDTEVTMGFSMIIGKETARDGRVLQARDAVYRSICFAAQVCDYILPDNYSCDLMSYMSERTDDWNNIGALGEDSRRYLSSRQAVATLLDDYMSEIDPSQDYSGDAELFASLVFMLSERSIGQRYIAESIDTLDISQLE